MKRITSILGLAVVALGLVGGAVLADLRISLLFAWAYLLMIVGGTWGILVLSYGWEKVLKAYLALFTPYFSLSESNLNSESEAMIRDAIGLVYKLGVFGLIFGCATTFSRTGGDIDVVRVDVARSLMALAPSFLIAECVLRPALRRVEGRGETRPTR